MERRIRTLVTLVAVVCLTVASGGIAAAGSAVDGSSTVASNANSSAVQADCSFPLSVTDTTGEEITLEEQPERIVVLQPSDAQIVWEIGAADRVVGMDQTAATNYLEDREGITNVKNDDDSANVEVVTNLSADLVLAANVTQSDTIDQLRNTGNTVYHFGEVGSMAETYRNINRTGQLVGNCGPAGERVGEMRDRLDRIEAAVSDAERPGVLYTFYGYAAGDDTHVNSMIEIAGGENVVASFGESGYVQVNREMIAANEPQWIVYPSDASPPTGAPYNETTAVQEDQVLEVNTNFINQAGPRTVDVVETMAQEFHPDAFDENGEPIVETPTATQTSSATPSSNATMSSNATATATTTDDGVQTTTEESGPGFTPVTVIVALVVATTALGVRRKGV